MANISIKGGYANGMGIKQVINDISATIVPLNSKISADLSIFTNFKNLNTYLILSGNLVFSIPTANADTATEIEITYKDDHFYNLISNVQLKANQTIFKNLQNNASFLRFWEAFYQLGHEYPSVIPQTATIPAGETSVSVPFEIYMNIPFAMLDMQNPQQTGLLTWLYSTINLSLTSNNVTNVIQSIDAKQGATEIENVSYKIDSVILESASNYQVVNNDYLTKDTTGAPLDYTGVFQKIGGLYKTDSMSQIFVSQGNNQLFKLLDTTTLSFKDIFIVFREADTLNRVEGVVDRIRITNGNSPLIDIRPQIIRCNNQERYKLIPKNFQSLDPDSPDGVGCLYGVYRVDTSYFGDLLNGELATNNWAQPQLYFDINKNINSLSGGLAVELYLGYKEVTKEMQARINAIAGSLSSASNV